MNHSEIKINAGLIANARMWESMDANTNYNKRNFLLLRNLMIPTGAQIPTQFKEKVQLVSNIIKSHLGSLKPVFVKDIKVNSVYLLPFGGDAQHFDAVRINCETPKDALEIKNRILDERNKIDGIWKDCEVYNDTVKATRVRVSIMTSIARRLRETGLDITVSRYTDSPMVIIKENGRIRQQLTYVDSVLKHGALLSNEDIAKARNLAGTSFKGFLEQVFLIIKETGVNVEIPTPAGIALSLSGSNQTPIGASRGAYRGRGGLRGRGGFNGGNRPVQGVNPQGFMITANSNQGPNLFGSNTTFQSGPQFQGFPAYQLNTSHVPMGQQQTGSNASIGQGFNYGGQ